MLNMLPTRVDLPRRWVIHGSHNLVCPMCFGDEESIPCMFLQFPIAAQVWRKTHSWIYITMQANTNLMVVHFKNFFHKLKENLFKVWFKDVEEVVGMSKIMSWDWLVTPHSGQPTFGWSDRCSNPLACIS